MREQPEQQRPEGSSPMIARAAPTSTSSSSGTNLLNNACYGEGTSVSTLSVETSTRGASTLNGVADLNEPAGNGTLGHGLAQCGRSTTVWGHNLSRSPLGMLELEKCERRPGCAP